MFRQLFLLSVFIYFVFTASGQQRFSFTRPKMGSPFTIIFYDADPLHAGRMADACFNLVDSFVNIYSDYIDSSELNMLSRSAGQNMYVPVTPALYDLLLQSQKAYILSKGSFDITLGPVTKLWRTARKQRVFPNSTAAKEALNLVGFNKVKIDTNSRTVMLRKSGMQLDAGGIAQGYIAQKVLDFLKQQHITSALIDVSGDIALGEPPPGKEGWNIGVNVPEQTSKLQNKKLLLSNCTVSTSGDVYQYIEHNGRKYSHIVDPKTGYGVTTRRNVTVIAADATTADWLATACSILPIRQAKRLTKKMNAALMIAYIKGERLIVKSTVNFTKYFNTQ